MGDVQCRSSLLVEDKAINAEGESCASTNDRCSSGRRVRKFWFGIGFAVDLAESDCGGSGELKERACMETSKSSADLPVPLPCASSTGTYEMVAALSTFQRQPRSRENAVNKTKVRIRRAKKDQKSSGGMPPSVSHFRVACGLYVLCLL